MPSSDSKDQLRRLVRIWVDALTYALAIAVLVTVVAMVAGIATGGGAVRGNVFLFVVGWILLAYTTVRLWPTSPEDVEPTSRRRVSDSISDREPSTRFQRLVRALPPARWVRAPTPEHRMTAPGKLLLGSLLILLVSFLLETAVGIA
ncbi:DUF7555 family protein [Natronorubrum halophilum]|nr:hypothetical protein [Natronorubrum halophilum]